MKKKKEGREGGEGGREGEEKGDGSKHRDKRCFQSIETSVASICRGASDINSFRARGRASGLRQRSLGTSPTLHPARKTNLKQAEERHRLCLQLRFLGPFIVYPVLNLIGACFLGTCLY